MCIRDRTGEAFERFKKNPIQVVSLSDFNAQMRALGKDTLTLSEGQFRIFYDMPQITPSVDTFLENNGKVTLNGATLESAGPAINCTIGTNFSFSNSGTLIVSDALAQNLPFDSAQLNINYKAPAAVSYTHLLQIFSHRKAAKTTTDHDSMLGSKGHKRFFKNISICLLYTSRCV